MLATLFASATFVLIASLVIAAIVRATLLKGSSIDDYLFGHNSGFLTVISNVGALLSLTVVAGGILTTTLGWGLTPIYGLLFGIGAGYASLGMMIRRLGPILSPSAGFTPTRLVLDLVDADTRALFNWAQLAMMLGLLSIEIGLMRDVLHLLLLDQTATAYVAVFFACLLSGVYVSLGGYAGVLRIDLFQVLLIGGSLYYLFPRLESAAASARAALSIPQTLTVSSWPMLIACIGCAFAIHFAMPDLWTRNIGTFQDPSLGKTARRRLAISGVLLFAAAIPFIILALALLSSRGQILNSVELPSTIVSLRALMAEAKLTGQETWWFVGGFLCISITALNTWLIAIAQHLAATRRGVTREVLYVTPFLAALVGFVVSAVVDGRNYAAFGLLGTVFAFANVAVLLVASIARRRISAPRTLRVYYATCLAVTVILLVLWRAEWPARIHEVALWQLAMAAVLGATLLSGARK
jgi:hypothetical protein